MKGPFYMFLISVFFVSTKEKCPLNVGNNSVTSCDGSTKYGPNIYIDFNEINHTCTCTVSPSFEGELLVTSTSTGIINSCYTRVLVQYFETIFNFPCPSSYSTQTLNVPINKSAEIRAEYVLPYTPGTFYHCLGFQQNGGKYGNLSVTCGSSTTTVSSTTVSITTLTSTQLSHASPFASSIKSTSVVNPLERTDVTLFSNTINVSYDSLSVELTQDDTEMLYIIAGSAGGSAIILVGLVVLILVLINRTRSAKNKNGSTEAVGVRTNEVFDSNPELPDNPLYLSSQPMDELGYNSDQEKQLGLPPTDSKTKEKISSNYDVPPNNKPTDHDDFRTVSSCDGSMRSGSFVFVDMNKIGRPCTCTVNSLFVGDLLVTSLKVTPLCNTKLTVNNTVIFYCNEAVSSTFKVGVNDILIVKAEHMSGNIKDNFNQCVGFSENGGRGGNLSVTCRTLPDWATTPTIFTTTTPSTPEAKSELHNNVNVIALSAAGGTVLFVILVVCSFILLRRRNRNNKAESPEVHITLSYKVFDSSNELPDNPLYNSCQTVEKVESHVASKQNPQIASLQQTALNTMHRIDPDYDVPSNNKPLDQGASSISFYEVLNTGSIKRDLSPMPLYEVPNNNFINRGLSPTPMYVVPQNNHERLPEVKDEDVNNQYYSIAKNSV